MLKHKNCESELHYSLTVVFVQYTSISSKTLHLHSHFFRVCVSGF